LVSLNDVHPRDIVIADPKYPDQQEPKTRPLLVISKNLFQQNSKFCICIGLTSNKEEDPYAVPYRQKDVVIGRLDRDGLVVCRRVVALRHDKILRKIGTQITIDLYQKVMAKLLGEVLEPNST